MPRYRVTVINVCSASLEVEAADADAAIEAVFEHDDMPGSLTIGGFGNGHLVDDSDWQVEDEPKLIKED